MKDDQPIQTFKKTNTELGSRTYKKTNGVNLRDAYQFKKKSTGRVEKIQNIPKFQLGKLKIGGGNQKNPRSPLIQNLRITYLK